MESAGMLSRLVLGLAVVGVFIEIPFVSKYAFWVAIAAYFIRFVTRIPRAPSIWAAVQKHARYRRSIASLAPATRSKRQRLA